MCLCWVHSLLREPRAPTGFLLYGSGPPSPSPGIEAREGRSEVNLAVHRLSVSMSKAEATFQTRALTQTAWTARVS